MPQGGQHERCNRAGANYLETLAYTERAEIMTRINDTKPNATGRSSGKVVGWFGKHLKPPKDEPWVWFTRAMLETPSWAALSINGRRAMDRLLLEHMAHAGTENGNLIATHDQFREFGISSSQIRPAIDELVFLGFIRCKRGGRWAGKNTPSKYRLTWLGDNVGAAPTNEWQSVRSEQIDAWKNQRRELRKIQREAFQKDDFRNKSGGTVTRLCVVRSGFPDESG